MEDPWRQRRRAPCSGTLPSDTEGEPGDSTPPAARKQVLVMYGKPRRAPAPARSHRRTLTRNLAGGEAPRGCCGLCPYVTRYYMKVAAFVCGCVTILLLITSLASTVWLETAGGKYKIGLWQRCVEEGVTTPLPYNDPPDEGCFYHSNPPVWLRATAILILLSFFSDQLATVLIGIALCTQNRKVKRKFFKYSMCIAFTAVLFMLIALVVFPSMFSIELSEDNQGQSRWEFGWAYGVGWGAAIFLFAAAILLLLDKESEEIFYKEKTIMHNSDSSA